MGEHLRRLWALFWIVTEHPVHEADGLRRCPRYYILQVNFGMLGHVEKLAVGEPPRIRPIIDIRFPQDHRNFMELVHFGRARKKGFEGVQLSHDAP